MRRPKGIEFTPIFAGTHGTKGIRPLFRALQLGASVGRRDCATHMIGARRGDGFLRKPGQTQLGRRMDVPDADGLGCKYKAVVLMAFNASQ